MQAEEIKKLVVLHLLVYKINLKDGEEIIYRRLVF